MAAIVYIATNRVNGKRYVGVTSKSLHERQRQHLNGARARRATCRAFHSAIRKHGADVFDWKVVAEFGSFDEALRAEIAAIADLKPEYNLTIGGQGSPGRVVSAEQRSRHSQLMKGRKQPPEAIAKMAAKIRGTKRTPEQRERMGAARRGKPFSEEHRRNLSLANTGKKQPPEVIERRIKAMLGRPLSDEHKESIRAALSGRKRPPEVVAKMLATRKETFAARRAGAAAHV